MYKVLNFNIPKVLLINPHDSFKMCLPKMQGEVEFYIVEKLIEGLQIAHNNDIDVIVLFADNTENKDSDVVWLSLQFKQSMVTRDIPVLLMTAELPLTKSMSCLNFCGLNHLHMDSTVQVFMTKVNQLSTNFRHAQSHESTFKDKI